MFLTKWMNFDPQKVNPKYTIKDKKCILYNTIYKIF